jgi:hypothetical protein
MSFRLFRFDWCSDVGAVHRVLRFGHCKEYGDNFGVGKLAASVLVDISFGANPARDLDRNAGSADAGAGVDHQTGVL